MRWTIVASSGDENRLLDAAHASGPAACARRHAHERETTTSTCALSLSPDSSDSFWEIQPSGGEMAMRSRGRDSFLLYQAETRSSGYGPNAAGPQCVSWRTFKSSRASSSSCRPPQSRAIVPTRALVSSGFFCRSNPRLHASAASACRPRRMIFLASTMRSKWPARISISPASVASSSATVRWLTGFL